MAAQPRRKGAVGAAHFLIDDTFDNDIAAQPNPQCLQTAYRNNARGQPTFHVVGTASVAFAQRWYMRGLLEGALKV